MEEFPERKPPLFACWNGMLFCTENDSLVVKQGKLHLQNQTGGLLGVTAKTTTGQGGVDEQTRVVGF